jgi:hypothetical protein
VHNAGERASVEEYISTTGTPQAQMYSPNYLRIVVPAVLRSARLSLRRNFFPSYSLSSPPHLHGMHSYEIDHSSADFSPTVFSLFLRFARARIPTASWYVFGFSLQRGKSH